jgi:hypothetical protein
MAGMICNACGRRVDATRSFCPRCGSAVFVDEGATNRSRLIAPPAQPRRPATVSTGRPQPAQPSGCLAPFARLILFVVLLWFVGRWLFSIQEVRTLVEALVNGGFSDEQWNAAARAIGESLADLLR